MPFATGSPVTALVDGIRTALLADATLVALVTSRIYGHVPQAALKLYPVVVLGHRTRDGAGGAMQKAGGRVTLQIDCWGGVGTNRGPFEVQAILSRIAVVLERQTVTVTGFTLIDGSLTCELEDVFDEPDADAPEQKLYHGVQRWAAEIHES